MKTGTKELQYRFVLALAGTNLSCFLVLDGRGWSGRMSRCWDLETKNFPKLIIRVSYRFWSDGSLSTSRAISNGVSQQPKMIDTARLWTDLSSWQRYTVLSAEGAQTGQVYSRMGRTYFMYAYLILSVFALNLSIPFKVSRLAFALLITFSICAAKLKSYESRLHFRTVLFFQHADSQWPSASCRKCEFLLFFFIELWFFWLKKSATDSIDSLLLNLCFFAKVFAYWRMDYVITFYLF